VWIYAILFLIIFCETGLVVTPFLPGDSLLFAIGSLAASGALDLTTCLILLTVAAILGDSVNYSIGAWIGPKAFHYPKSRWLNPEHLKRAHEFYERHGGKTIIIARFLPIIRTFAPFVAGIGRMTYSHFLFYNVTGAFIWIFSITYLGYFFGGMEIVQKNFSLVILAIIVISLLPIVVEWWNHHRAGKAAAPESNAPRG